MANHDLLGTKIMGIGGFFEQTREKYDEFIAKANIVAKNIKSRGFKFTYHNHSHEFRLLDGKTIMDILLEGMDPDNTGFVLDTYWVQHGGGDVRYWIEKLAGRIDILHLKEMGRNNNGPFITEVGNGNIWWEGVLATAEKAGVKHYVVEQDSWPGDPFDSIAQSAAYLKKFVK
jgi:sugar phosphate isomerase/epimerase